MRELNQTKTEIGGFYEYQGVENYNPTGGFLKQIYIILTVQLITVILLSSIMVFFFWFMFMSKRTSTLLILLILFCAILWLVGSFIVVLDYFEQIRSSPIKILLLFFVRTLSLSLLTTLISVYLSTFLLFYGLCLCISLQLTLMVNAALMKRTFDSKNAMSWLVCWGLVAILLLLYGLNLKIVEALMLVLLYFFYGTYFICESEIILKDSFYSINYHECMLGALLFQFEVVHAVFHIKRIFKPSSKRD